MELNKSESFIAKLIENNEVVYSGKIAYGRIDSKDRFLSKIIGEYEYPAYAYGIIFPHADEKVKKANRHIYLQRVPELDIEEASIVG